MVYPNIHPFVAHKPEEKQESDINSSKEETTLIDAPIHPHSNSG